MDGSKLNLTSLRDKISSKLGKPNKKEVKSGKKNKKEQEKPVTESKNEKKSNVKSKKVEEETEESEETEEDVLRREALSLGATEEDLALLAGVEEGEESEQEFSGDGKLDSKFADDLTKFISGIGLGKGEAMVVESEDEVPELVEEEEDEEEEASEDEESSSEDEEEEAVEQKEASEKEESSSSEEEEEEEASEDEIEVQQTALIKKKAKDYNASDKVEDLSSVNSSKLAIPNRTDWYNVPFDKTYEAEKQDRFGLERLTERAQKTLESENKIYLQEFTSNNSQKKFLSQILSDGTLNDKISALTLLIQESPLHNMKAFDTLLGYCEKKSRTAALQSINAMKDLLLNGVLPDRKLVAFTKQPLNRNLPSEQLAVYFFEDYMKKSYFKLISVLEVLSHDPIVHVRMNVVNHVFDLIKAKPEQEANLLRLGVNKLGDIDNKVAAKASYQILQLEQAHPAMKKIITDAVIDIVFKTNSDYHAKYYAILTLNQTILTRREDELANSLVKTYFTLFEKILVESDSFNAENKKDDKTLGTSEKGRKNNRKNFKKGKKGGKSVKHQEKTESELVEEKNTRLFSALLTGLNRAFPFSSLSNETFQKHLDTLFKITHSTNFNTSVQALVLINHIITQQKLDSNRYYRTLYESLLDPRLVTSSKQGIYLNLLFKSLKNDTGNIPRVLAFVKRILQICCHWLNVGAISGMLYLLMELGKTYPQIQDLTIEEASRPELEEDSTTAKDTERVYDSKKRDPNFANADKSSLWELNQFLNHYHPTIAIYAESLLNGTQQPKPDLGLFTLAHFLDRFVYKNAKQKATTKGSSIMQPLGGAHTGSLLVKATNVSNKELPANTEDWLNRKASEIKPDEKFFHQYFTSKKNKLISQKEEQEEMDEEEAEQMEDTEIWNALVKSRPEVEDGSDEEGFSDFDEDDFSEMSDDEELEEDGEESAAKFIDDEAEVDEEDDEETGEQNDEEDDEEEIFGMNSDEYDSDEVPIKMLGEDDDEDSEDEDEEIEEETVSKKRSKSDESSKSKKAKLKSLPVFADADEYSKYLDSDDEDYS
ncbi:ribosome biogenesis protein Mak21p [[Candida] anglica]